MNLQNLNYTKLAIIFGIVFAYGLLFGFIIIPKIVKFIIKLQVRLKPGIEARDIWNETPFPLHFHIYLFNITNPEEYKNGGKVKVQEIGPYYFDEWKDKFDQEENEEEDSVTFSMRNTYIFRKDLSNGLTGDELVTLPHPLVTLIGIVIQRTRKPLLNIIANGLKTLFPDDYSAVYTGKAMDLLFNGIPINCDTDDFNAKAICAAFHGGDAKSVRQHNDTTFLCSFMAALNHTNVGRYTVCRGIKNIRKLGKVIKLNDETDYEIWHGDECNELRGTDGTIFAPYMNIENPIWAATADVCRSLGPKYQGKSKYAGLPASRFTFDFGDLKNEPENYCFCGENPPDDCPVKGTMNLAPCLDDVPIIGSLPHFLNGDESLFENIEGLAPDPEKHLNIFDFETNSGTPFKAAKRLQLSLDQEPVEMIEPLSKLRKMIVPLLWVEEGLALNKTYVNMVRPIFIAKTINSITRWLSLIVGTIGLVGSGFMIFKKLFGTLKIYSIKAENSVDEINLQSNNGGNGGKQPSAITPVLGEKTNIDDVITDNNDVDNQHNGMKSLNGHSNLNQPRSERY